MSPILYDCKGAVRFIETGSKGSGDQRNVVSYHLTVSVLGDSDVLEGNGGERRVVCTAVHVYLMPLSCTVSSG